MTKHTETIEREMDDARKACEILSDYIHSEVASVNLTLMYWPEVRALVRQFTRLDAKEQRQKRANVGRGGRPTGRKDSYQRTRPKRKTEKAS